MKKSNKTPFAIALGGTIVTSLIAPAIQANTHTKPDSNPFSLTKSSPLSDTQTAESDLEKDNTMKMKNGACGEGKCGSSMAKGSEEKTAEGQCAGNKAMPKMNKNKKGKAW